MELYLKGKRVLVTGASAGIGLAVASLFAEEGCDLLLAARKTEQLQAAADRLIQQYSIAVTTIAVDLADQSGTARLVAEAGPIDILVNNAGAIPPGNLLEVEDGTWREAWNLKVFGYIHLTRLLYPRLKAAQGVVVNIIGSSGERAEPNYLAGSTGNAALMAFTRGLGSASPKDGVRVVGVNPGAVATKRIETLLRSRAERTLGDGARWREFYSSLSFGRAASPEEVANAVVFLASSRLSYTSGTILTMDDPARASL